MVLHLFRACVSRNTTSIHLLNAVNFRHWTERPWKWNYVSKNKNNFTKIFTGKVLSKNCECRYNPLKDRQTLTTDCKRYFINTLDPIKISSKDKMTTRSQNISYFLSESSVMMKMEAPDLLQNDKTCSCWKYTKTKPIKSISEI